MTDAAVVIGAAVRDMCDDLDRILDRVLRNDAHLALEPEGKFWLVVDQANLYAGESTVMMRTLDRGTAIRFAYAFKQKHPETVLDASLSGSAGTGDNQPPVVGVPAEEFSVRVPHLRVVG